MQYLKVQKVFRATPIFQRAGMAERGTWVSLAGLCADEENGGRIAGGSTWNDRQWMQACGCTSADVEAAICAGFATMDGSDLVISGYDVIGEATYIAKRTPGSLGGKAKAAKHPAHATADARPSALPYARPNGRAHARPDATADARPLAVPDALAFPRAINHIPDTNTPPPPTPASGGGAMASGGVGAVAPSGFETTPDETTPPDVQARLTLIEGLGGWLTSKTDQSDQRAAWLDATDGLTPEQIATLFARSSDLAGGALRYPDRAKAVRVALRAEQQAKSREAKRLASASESQQAEHERAERMRRDDDTALPVLERVRAWILALPASWARTIHAELAPAAEPFWGRIVAGKPVHGPALALAQLIKHPHLAAVARGEDPDLPAIDDQVEEPETHYLGAELADAVQADVEAIESES